MSKVEVRFSRMGEKILWGGFGLWRKCMWVKLMVLTGKEGHAWKKKYW